MIHTLHTTLHTLAAGADVNAQDQIEDSPYLLAGARGHVAILRMKLAAGADLKSMNRYGGTALTHPTAYKPAPTIAAGANVSDHL